MFEAGTSPMSSPPEDMTDAAPALPPRASPPQGLRQIRKSLLIARLFSPDAHAQPLLSLGAASPGASSGPGSSTGHSGLRVTRDGPLAVRGAAHRIRAPTPARAGDDVARVVRARNGGGHARARPTRRRSRTLRPRSRRSWGPARRRPASSTTGARSPARSTRAKSASGRRLRPRTGGSSTMRAATPSSCRGLVQEVRSRLAHGETGPRTV
jgi:hypothetical protein